MEIQLHLGIQSRCMGFGKYWQSSIGLLLCTQCVNEFDHVCMISKKRGQFQCPNGRNLRIFRRKSVSKVVGKDEIVLSFPDEKPIIVLSAMGKIKDKLLLAGEKAVRCGASNVSEIDELKFIKDLHLKMVNELRMHKTVVSVLLEELEQLLKGIALMKELIVRTSDYLMSFGECMSTRIFAEYFNQIGTKARKVLHPKSMHLAKEGDIPVRVKNSYNPHAQGTLITKERDMSKTILTSIVLKSSVTMLDIVSTRMLGRYVFLAKVFSIFAEWRVSIDCVVTSEVSISLTLDPSKQWNSEIIQKELNNIVEELEKIAVVKILHNISIISLIGNVQQSSMILEKVFGVLHQKGINVQMISQGASKVNISIVVHDSEAKECITALHSAFFENFNGLKMKPA